MLKRRSQSALKRFVKHTPELLASSRELPIGALGYVKQSIAQIPVFGPMVMRAWRLLRDPGFDPIAQQISGQLPKWKAHTVVQIGANDGQLTDPICLLVKNRPRWRALFVEPIPSVFNQLVANYGRARRFMFEQAAVSDESGNFSFFFLSAEAKGHARVWRDWFDGVGSFDRSHVVRALEDQAEHLDRFIQEIRVPVMTLQMLLSKWDIAHVDLLVIDTEGHDLRIVRQALRLKKRPKIILFEHINLSTDDRLSAFRLLKADYDIHDVGMDFLCINKRALLRT
jgi:FkbM family methyltransferase